MCNNNNNIKLTEVVLDDIPVLGTCVQANHSAHLFPNEQHQVVQ